MSSNLTRAKEATIQVTVDGVRQRWSRLIKNFKIKPDAERPRTRHVGQARAQGHGAKPIEQVTRKAWPLASSKGRSRADAHSCSAFAGASSRSSRCRA